MRMGAFFTDTSRGYLYIELTGIRGEASDRLMRKPQCLERALLRTKLRIVSLVFFPVRDLLLPP